MIHSDSQDRPSADDLCTYYPRRSNPLQTDTKSLPYRTVPRSYICTHIHTHQPRSLRLCIIALYLLTALNLLAASYFLGHRQTEATDKMRRNLLPTATPPPRPRKTTPTPPSRITLFRNTKRHQAQERSGKTGNAAESRRGWARCPERRCSWRRLRVSHLSC